MSEYEELNKEPVPVPTGTVQPVEETSKSDDTVYANEPGQEVKPEGSTSAPEAVKKKIVKSAVQEVELFIEEPKWDDADEVVNLPSALKEQTIEAITKVPNVNMVDNKHARKWANTFADGIDHASFGGFLESTLNDEDADFRQGVQVEKSTAKLAGSHPKFSPVENETMTGQRGVLRMMSYLGMGTIFQIPLWHTGIWVTIKAPSEGELLELQRQIISDKIAFGRQSYGLAFSNQSSYIADRLISFVLNHLYETTLSENTDLKSVISTHDIPALLWGMACAIYPRGFQYRRACVTNPDKCNHIVEERLNLSKILWTNTRALAPSQVVHMSKRRINTMTLDSVKKYQEELLKCQKREIVINEGSSKPLKMTLRIPNVAEYIDSGHRWISDLVSMVNKALGIDADDSDRNDYVLKQGQASAMRQYLHWVDSIEFNGNSIEERETLESTFDVLSSDDNIRNEFMKKVHSYIDDTAIAVVGIPVYDCPKCGETQVSGLPKQTSIIPIDVYQTFFTLLVQKLQKLTVR